MAKRPSVVSLATSGASARRPSQKRSYERVQLLLDAADTLLQDHDIANVGYYDIARAAGVPGGSAYHFFQTKEAVFLGLAERYISMLRAILAEEIGPNELEGWQDFIIIRYNRVVRFFNAHVAARKLLLGTGVGSDVKDLDVKNVENNATQSFRELCRYFDVPYVKNPFLKFSTLIGIYDGIWMTSYARHGLITEDFAREALTAGLAYCETFLPKVIPLRRPATLGDGSDAGRGETS